MITAKKRIFFLLAGDILILYFSLYLTLFLRYYPFLNHSIWQNHFIPFTIIYSFWLIIFYINNLYDLRWHRLDFNFFATILRSLLICSFLAILFFYFIPYFGITPKFNLFLNVFIFIFLFLLWRLVFYYLISKQEPTNRILLIGTTNNSLELAKEIIAHPLLGYKLITLIELNNNLRNVLPNIKLETNLDNLEEIIRDEKINTVVVDNALYREVDKQLYSIFYLGINIFDLSTFWEKYKQEIPISITEEIWFLENFRHKQKNGFELIKRIFDICFALIFGLISLIFYPLIILAIKLNSPGPVFYCQQRVGKNNKVFKIIKFRTMNIHAEKNGPQWSSQKDERITGIGRILRKTRIDELPQLLNILKGQLSLIGPRPERPEFTKELEKKIPHYQLRHLIKPGLTGWAQINYSYSSSVDEAQKKLHYDLYYVKNRSFFLDLEIALKTISTVLSLKGR